jgi:hypothetical protein
MLAANVESGKQVGERPNAQYQSSPSSRPEEPTQIGLDEKSTVARREEEEEDETDADAEFDDEIESEFEDAADYREQGYVSPCRKGGKEVLRYRSETPELPVYRKRSHDAASEEPEVGPITPPPMREGTPPKRPRLGEAIKDKTLAPVLDAPPLRQRKRSSEELEGDAQELDGQDIKRAKAQTSAL